MGKKAGISILVLVITSCVVLSAALIAGGYFLLRAQRNYTPPTAAAVVTPQEVDVSGEMDEIQEQVSSIRGLDIKTDLLRDLMTPDALKDKVINDFFVDYTSEEARQDAQILSTLGLVEPGYNLLQFYTDLYSEQIAGFYDSETKEMYVVAADAFGGMERMTYAHEFTHALQDQNYDLENGLKLNDDYCETDTEYCAAVSALIEGDATLTEQFWFMQHATQQDQKDLFSFQESYSSPVYDSAPGYMKRDFLFPYQEGFEFVQALQAQGNWSAVDAAYAQPPVTTEQILHPEKYPDDSPTPVEIPDLTPLLGEGWEEWDRNVMGEWYTYLIFAYGRSPQFTILDDRAKTAAAGWGGDTYVYYGSPAGEETLFVWRLTWDAPSDTAEFFEAARTYGLARWANPDEETESSISWTSIEDGKILMRSNGTDVLWLMGSSEEILNKILAQFPDFVE